MKTASPTCYEPFEIVLVSNDLVHWKPAFYCFPQDDLHRVAFVKSDTTVGQLECFKHIKKI